MKKFSNVISLLVFLYRMSVDLTFEKFCQRWLLCTFKLTGRWKDRCACLCVCVRVSVYVCVCVCMSHRPTKYTIYVRFMAARFQKNSLLIVQYKMYKNLCGASQILWIWSSAHDLAVLVLSLSMIKSIIFAWSIWPGGNDLYQLGTSFKRADQRADP